MLIVSLITQRNQRKHGGDEEDEGWLKGALKIFIQLTESTLCMLINVEKIYLYTIGAWRAVLFSQIYPCQLSMGHFALSIPLAFFYTGLVKKWWILRNLNASY